MNNLKLQEGSINFQKNEDGTLSLKINGSYEDSCKELSIEEIEKLKNFLNKNSKNFKFELSKKQIDEINSNLDYVSNISQSIYDNQIQIKIETGGVSGGSCWDDSDPQDYSNNVSISDITIFDSIFEVLILNITHLQSRKVLKLLESKIDFKYKSDYEYYGNSTDYKIWNIPLETLYETINEVV
jgi:hypothetical protein